MLVDSSRYLLNTFKVSMLIALFLNSKSSSSSSLFSTPSPRFLAAPHLRFSSTLLFTRYICVGTAILFLVVGPTRRDQGKTRYLEISNFTTPVDYSDPLLIIVRLMMTWYQIALGLMHHCWLLEKLAKALLLIVAVPFSLYVAWIPTDNNHLSHSKDYNIDQQHHRHVHSANLPCSNHSFWLL